jgi:S-DNA-T family DNA segregation ATPase FtsK/SpoIIIE
MKLETQLKEKIQLFEKTVTEDLALVNKRLDKLKTDLTDLDAERENVLNQMAKKHNDIKEELIKKCDYLKAEVWRYKHLLEEYVKAKTGPEMDERLKELELAVNEHTELKINLQEEKMRKEKKEMEQEFATEIDNLETKITLLNEQIESKIDGHIAALKTYFKENISIFKGTTENDNLVNFDHADYSSHSQSIRIGSTHVTFETPVSKKSIVYPVLMDFQDTKNLVMFYDDKSRIKAESVADSLILRILSSNLPDKINLHLYDSHMFEMFGEFLKLPGKVMKKGSSHKELAEEIDALQVAIREKLSLVWSDLNDGQQSILEYNIKKIKEANFDDIIPYHLFVVDNCQSLLSKSDAENLFEKMHSLTRYSSNFVLMFKTSSNDSEDVTKLMNSISPDMFSVIDFTGKREAGIYTSPDFESNNLKNDDKKVILDEFLIELSDVEKNRVNVKYIHHFEKEREKWFTGKAATSVTVPVGKSLSSDGKEYISFNTKNELSHILMVGGTGSGKTNFLTTIITSIAVNYSPDEVDLYLIDMKSGAGFSIFETEKLPHAKLFIFSAENELINDVFVNLKNEMDRRYELYAKYNIDNLEDVYKDPTLSADAPKRIIVIIDEFASIFTDDEMYHDEISGNILNIALKGRAMGINLFFATQNFSSVRASAFVKAMSQFATRIVLKGDPDSSLSILDYTNNRDYMNIGKFEGFVNKNYGQISHNGGNQFFKSFHLDNDDLRPILKEIRQQSLDKGFKDRSGMLIDGVKPAVFSTNIEMFNWLSQENAKANYQRSGILAYLGESFLMKEPNHFCFNWRINGKTAGQHILISGNEREVTIQSIFSLLSSIAHSVPAGKCAFKLINPFDEDYSKELGISLLLEKLKDYSFEMFAGGELGSVFRKLNILLTERKQSKDRNPIIVILPGLELFVNLHRAADYEEKEEAKLLNALLSEGSNYGLYFICEINKPSNLSKMGNADQYLNQFEHRIAYSMHSDESRTMIESNLANQLVSIQNQSIRNKGLYYNHSSQERYKFKAYVDILQSEQFVRKLEVSQNQLYLLSNIDEMISDNAADAEETPNNSENDVIYIDADLLNPKD